MYRVMLGWLVGSLVSVVGMKQAQTVQDVYPTYMCVFMQGPSFSLDLSSLFLITL